MVHLASQFVVCTIDFFLSVCQRFIEVKCFLGPQKRTWESVFSGNYLLCGREQGSQQLYVLHCGGKSATLLHCAALLHYGDKLQDLSRFLFCFYLQTSCSVINKWMSLTTFEELIFQNVRGVRNPTYPVTWWIFWRSWQFQHSKLASLTVSSGFCLSRPQPSSAVGI